MIGTELLELNTPMQDALLYVDHNEESAVSKASLHIPRYTNQPALGSHKYYHQWASTPELGPAVATSKSNGWLIDSFIQ